ARHVHQHALDPLHGYIDDDRPRRAREYQLDILARNQLEDGLQPVQYLVDVDRFEPAGLLLAVRRQLPQETRGTGDLAEQPFAVGRQRRIAVADGVQPLMAVVTHVTQQVRAGHRDFRREPADRFQPVRLAKLFFHRAQLGDVLYGDFDQFGGNR